MGESPGLCCVRDRGGGWGTVWGHVTQCPSRCPSQPLVRTHTGPLVDSLHWSLTNNQAESWQVGLWPSQELLKATETCVHPTGLHRAPWVCQALGWRHSTSKDESGSARHDFLSNWPLISICN